MSKPERKVVLSLLLALLLAALVNVYFIFHVYSGALKTAAETARSGPFAASQGSLGAGGSGTPGPGIFLKWYGDVSLKKTPAGGYDMFVTAGERGTPVPLTAVEIDLRRPGGKTAEITPSFKRAAGGIFSAHVDFPAPGDWEARVRLHRANETLEFARKFSKIEAAQK